MAIHRDIPPGFVIEWREDAGFGIPTSTHLCSMPHCENVAVAYLTRTVRREYGRSPRKWYCCPEHMYGREIRDGKVMIDYLREAIHEQD